MQAGVPLALFEEYMLLDDTPEYPMDPVLLLKFSGILDAALTREAFERALERHPLLSSRAVRKGLRFRWEPSDEPPTITRWDYDANPSIFNSAGYPTLTRVDLLKGPGLRIYVVESKRENWTRLYFHFHHAVADGMGMLFFVSDALTIYGQKIGSISADVKLPEVELTRFSLRNEIGWSFKSYLKNYFNTWKTTWQHIGVYPRALVTPPPRGRVTLERDRPFIRTLTLSREETTAYVRRAKSLGVTLNDLALGDYFAALERWLTEVRHDARRGKLRVMAPINMRKATTFDRSNMSCCNVVSTVFLDRDRRSLRRSREEIVRGVADEMNWVKRTDQRYVFLLVLRVLRCAPGSLRFFLRFPTCRATSVFTNLGKIFDAFPAPRDEFGRIVLGESVLEDVVSKSPIRHKTATAVAAHTYAGQLSLCLHYDSRIISHEDAERFNEIFKDVMFDGLL